MIDSIGTRSTGSDSTSSHLEWARRRQRDQPEADQRRMQDDRCREAGLHAVRIVLFLQGDEAEVRVAGGRDAGHDLHDVP